MKFTAPWCKPCESISPFVDTLNATYKFRVVETDIDKHPELVERYEVKSLPTFVSIDENGNVVDRLVGSSQEMLRQFFDRKKRNQISKLPLSDASTVDIKGC